MTSSWDTLVDAHAADGFPIAIAYSRDAIKKDAVSEEVRKGKVLRFIQPAPLPVGNILRASTFGDIQVLQGFMVVFAATARECVEGLEAWLLRVGFKSRPGVVGKPLYGPRTYSTINVLEYDAIGDVEQFAEPYGEVYAIEQYIRISIA